MKGLSIRTRLTIGIVLATAAVSVLGVLFGMNVLESQVRSAAIDQRHDEFVQAAFFDSDVREFEELHEAEFGFAEEVLDFDDVIEFEGEVYAVEELEGEVYAVEEFEGEVYAVEELAVPDDVQNSEYVALTRALVDQLPDFDSAVDAIGSTDGELLVWMGEDSLVALSSRSADVRSVGDVADAPIVPFSELLEIGLLPDVYDDFSDDDLFAPLADDDRTFEFGQRTLGDGQRIGYIAEVTDELESLEAIAEILRNVVLALTAVAGLATWFIAGRALRPVGAITDQVRAISAGTLAERVPEPSGTDEVGVLARTMNAMLARLEDADLRRRQFVSDASHELRTPVAVLRSEAEVARRAPDSTTIEAFSDVVLGESARLEHLVEDLLALARSDEADTLTATKAIDVDEIVLDEAARGRSLPIDKSAVSAGRVIGHCDDVRRIVAHLLDNAARHGDQQVRVGLQTAGSSVQLWVDDDGTGISEAERQRVFERFVRLDDARTRDQGGAGLGLAVVRETVQRMGGTIRLVDSPIGGARFEIEFPAA